MDNLGCHYSDHHTSKQPISNFHSLKALDLGEGEEIVIIKLILIRVNLLCFQNKMHAFFTSMISRILQSSREVGISLLILQQGKLRLRGNRLVPLTKGSQVRTQVRGEPDKVGFMTALLPDQSPFSPDPSLPHPFPFSLPADRPDLSPALQPARGVTRSSVCSAYVAQCYALCPSFLMHRDNDFDELFS